MRVAVVTKFASGTVPTTAVGMWLNGRFPAPIVERHERAATFRSGKRRRFGASLRDSRSLLQQRVLPEHTSPLARGPRSRRSHQLSIPERDRIALH
jgi:hypothetical protein